MEGTDSLRELAPRWSLAGDEKLLDLLQNTHQRIVSRCQEVNTKLDEMSTALDSASINLQNVNNRFMALSNSQFIESRVYDDDADVTMEPKPVDEPQIEVLDELDLMKRGLTVLDAAHELTEIIDSDTDDSDVQISVVLKPKDVYAHRPLPYIIGSQAWKNKWHAGLMVEDSDTDSVTSKPDLMVEEYSESEDDVGTHHEKLAPDATISETSSSFHSERDRELVPEKKQTPADIAAELAARLGNAPPRVLEEPEDLPQSTPKPVYRPHKPLPSTIFSDEPPPLDDQDQYSDTQDDDIFAEINKKQPYNNSSKDQNRLPDDLFGKPVDDYEFEKEQRSVKQKSTIFDDDSEPELFVDKPNTVPKESSRRNDTDDVKKPIGGISLFGSNKGTEIGAAILKRNQRKSSSDESDENTNNIKDTADDYEDTNNANYIFDNLFAKAKQAEQKLKQASDKPIKEKPLVKKVIEKPKPKEVIQKSQPKEVKDLFSDNIFDDIDDIFTSNIKIPTKEANKIAKSIFDEDDDDLFSDTAKTPKETTKDTKASSSNKKSIFDSDDELFSDVKVTKDTKKDIVNEKPKESESQISKPTAPKETNNNTTKGNEETSIFDDSPKQIESKIKPKARSKSIFDSDSDDDLFSDVNVKTIKSEKVKESNDIVSETESELFKGKETEKPVTVTDLLKKKETATLTDTLKAEKSKEFQSPSLFEEDEIDDLFINANKVKFTETAVIEHKIPDIVNKDEFTKANLEFTDANIPKVVDNVKPVIVDTKPYVFPKIDEPKTSDKFKEETEVKDTKAVSENVTNNEASPINAQKSYSIDVDVDSKLQKPSKRNVDTNNSENETVLPKEQELFSTTEISESKNNENIIDVKEKQDENRTDEVIEKEDLIPQKKNQIAIANLNDIFTEPPAFEKTKEVKKTTNVNALFDDDSDDEALFFKKNDVISDEKPDIFSPSADFGLFNDEPPAFVDLTVKSNKNDDDLFTSIDKVDDNVINQSDDEWNDEPEDDRPKIFEEDYLFSPETSNADLKSQKSASKILSKDIPDSDDELFSNITKDDPSPKPESTKEGIDQLDDIKKDKKIGKLNTKNYNINVQALVPGASPKKIPKDLNEDTKITNIDDKTKDIETTDNAEQKTVKSITFEKPASGVLDNNLSKQRPRIQVKRRPSSRKARHEAVRKSVIDLDDDTDNSSSFDEPLPKLNQNKTIKHENQDQIAKADKLADGFTSVDESSPKIQGKSEEHTNRDQTAKTTDNLSDDFDFLDEKDKSIQNQDEILKTSTIDELLQESNDNKKTQTDKLSEYESNTHKKNNESNVKITSPKVNIEDLLNSDDNTFKEINEDLTKSRNEVDANVKINENDENQSTTKVKYILNDEDIFSKSPENNLFKNTESDDDLFKNKGIKTIGNTYKDKTKIKTTNQELTKSNTQPINRESSKSVQIIKNKESSKTVNPKKDSKSLFELSDDDDDLFGKSIKTKKVEVKTKLFDSDSEEDLFSGKKKVREESKKVKEVKVGGSLFGDDDDDLFGAKTKKTTTVSTKISASTSRSASKDTKSTEVVFDDPLSMLDDD